MPHQDTKGSLRMGLLKDEKSKPAARKPAPTAEELNRRIERLRTQEEPEGLEEDKDFFDWVNEFNTGIARTLNFLIEPMWAGAPEAMTKDRKTPRQIMAELGMAHREGEAGQDFGSRFLQDLGSMSIPLAGQTAKGARVAEQVRRGLSISRLTPSQRAAFEMVKNPGKTAIGETLSSAAAVQGGFIGERLSDDSLAGRAVGELLGGLSPSVVSSLISTGVETGKRFVPAWNRRQRAQRRIQNLSGKAAEELEQARTENILGLDPMEASGDPGVISIRNAAMREDHKLASRLYTREAKAMQRAEHILLNKGDPRSARAFLNNLVSKYLASVKKRLTRLTPKKEDPTAIIADELRSAYSRGRKTETKVWKRLKNPAVDTADADNTWEQILRSRLPEEDPADIPNYLRRFLGDLEKEGRAIVFKPGELKPRARNVQALRSRIIEDIAEESTKRKPNRNKIRILAKVQEGLLNSLKTSSTGPEYDAALEFSRSLNDRFTKGFVGRFLGVSADDDFAFSGVTGDVAESLKRATPRDQQKAVHQLLAASPKSRNRIVDTIKQSFMAQAVDSGVLRKDRAAKFLQRNKKMLDEFPDVRDEIQAAIKDQTELDKLLGDRLPVSMSPVKKRMAVTGLYLDAPVGEEINRILTQTDNPASAFRELAKTMKVDKEAMRGLRTAVKGYLLDRSKGGSINILGGQNISGNRMLKLLEENGKAFRVVLPPSEFRRIRQVARELAKIETAHRAGAAGGGVISDPPAKVLSLLSRYLGAQAGQRAAGSGIGSGLVLAQAGSKEATGVLGHLTNDKARELLLQAVEDDDLWQDLVTNLTEVSAKQRRRIFQNVSSWLAGPTATATGQKEENPKDPLQERINRLGQQIQSQGVRER